VITAEGIGRERWISSWKELWKNWIGARKNRRKSNIRQVSLKRPRRCWRGGRVVVGKDEKQPIDWAIEEL
jgi:hypothetical protein